MPDALRRSEPYTPSEDARIAAMIGKVPDEEIARHFGRTLGGIRKRINKLRRDMPVEQAPQPLPRSHYTAAEDRMIKQMAGRIPADRIARILSRPKEGIHHRIKKLGLDGKLTGEHHWNTKVSNLVAGMIGALYDAGYTVNEIHKVLTEPTNTSLSTVVDIAACRTRKGNNPCKSN